jgi:predicted ATP-dependent endonuclease of OLD family
MRLIKVGCSGYKRFRDRAEMDVDEKLIAIVGPNEAGKSSFLEALAHLEDDAGFSPSLRTRGASTSAAVWARFVLDDDDKAALAGVPEAHELRQFIVTKSSSVSYDLVPDVSRDPVPRQVALKLLDRALAHRWLKERGDDDELVTLARQAREVLAAEQEDLEDMQIDVLDGFVAAIKGAPLPSSLSRLSNAMATARANESKENPWVTTIDLLTERRPRFLLFETDARELRSSYSFDEPPNRALYNLLALAGTSWESLHEASSDSGALEGVLERAREQLDATFSAWKQAPLVVRINVADNAVSVMVRMSARFDYLGIEERSDGLRQFVALRAHVARHGGEGGPPILLIDEADVHLHYNAQADLVQVLETQEQAAKVIYTTHSAGCLPQDLGRGIRVIIPVEGTDDSKVVNWFWTDEIEGTGFSPILIGMGASAFAFASTRRAVIAEGASDAILLPSLLRQAVELDRLDYQVAPGLANVDAAAAHELDLVAARVAYILDGDAAGDGKEKLLLDAGVPKERIVRLGSRRSPIVLEDLLDENVYLAAVNEELGRWNGNAQMPKSALTAMGRPAAVEAWCKSQSPQVPVPSKRAVAHRVLDGAHDHSLVPSNRREMLRKLHRALSELLDQPSHRAL